MIRLAPLITADVDTTTLPGGKASDAAQDFLALLSEALAGETTTDKAAPQLLVATDKPTTKGEPLVSEILADAQQADLLIPVDETPPVINDEQSTSTPLTTAQTMTLAAVAGNNTAKDEKADDLNEDVTASLSLFIRRAEFPTFGGNLSIDQFGASTDFHSELMEHHANLTLPALRTDSSARHTPDHCRLGRTNIVTIQTGDGKRLKNVEFNASIQKRIVRHVYLLDQLPET